MVLGSNAASQILAAQQAGVMQNHAYAQQISQPQMNPMGGFETSQMSAPSGMHMGFGMGSAAHHQAPALMRGAASAGSAGMFGLGLAAAFNYAPRAFDPFTSTIHNMGRGWAGGGLSGAIGAGAVTAGAYMAIGSAASYMTRNIMAGAQQQVHAASTIQGGYGMSGMQMGQMSVPMANNLASQMMPTVDAAGRAGLGNLVNAGSMTNIMGQGMASGAFRGVKSAGQFRQVLNRLTGEALQMSQVLKSSIEDARSTLDSMNRDFGMGASEATATVSGMGSMMSHTGMGVSAQMGMARYGSQVFQGMGLSRLQGARYGIGLGQSVGFAANQGMLSQSTMRDVGGAQNFTSRLTQAGIRIFSGRAGTRLLGAMMGDDGGLDADMAQRIASGAATREEINKAYRENVKGRAGRGQLMQSRSGLIGDFMSQHGTGGAVTGLDTFFSNRSDKDWMVQATSGLQGNEMGLLQGLEGANPMIKFRMKQAAQEGLQSGGLQGKSISQVVDTMVSKLVGPIRDKFRGWGRSISAGISEATDDLGRSLLGQGPQMHRGALGHGVQSSMNMSTMMGTGNIASRQYSGALNTVNAMNQGWSSFNQFTGGAFAPGGIMNNIYAAGAPGDGGVVDNTLNWMGSHMGGTPSLGEDIPFFSPGGMGLQAGIGDMSGFGKSWGYGTEQGYGNLTSWGRAKPTGLAGMVNSFIPDAFRISAQGGDPWEAPKYGMTGASGWGTAANLALLEGAPQALAGSMARFGRWRARGGRLPFQRPAGPGALTSAVKWARRSRLGGPMGATVRGIGGLWNRGTAALAASRAGPGLAAAGRFMFGPPGGGLGGLGWVRGAGRLTTGTLALGGRALTGASRLAGKVFYPLMAAEMLYNYSDYNERIGGSGDIGFGISTADSTNLFRAAAGGAGWESGDLKRFAVGSSFDADKEANDGWGLGLLGQTIGFGFWGNDGGGQLGNESRGLISQGYIPMMGMGRTSDGRSHGGTFGTFTDSYGFGDDNQMYGLAVKASAAQRIHKTMAQSGQTSDIVRRLRATNRGELAEEISRTGGSNLRRGMRGVEKVLSEQYVSDNMLRRRNENQGPRDINVGRGLWPGTSQGDAVVGDFFPRFNAAGVGYHGGVQGYMEPQESGNYRLWGNVRRESGKVFVGDTMRMFNSMAQLAVRRRLSADMTDEVMIQHHFGGQLSSRAQMQTASEQLTNALGSYYAYGHAAQYAYTHAADGPEKENALLALSALGLRPGQDPMLSGPFSIPREGDGGATQKWDPERWQQIQSVMDTIAPGRGWGTRESYEAGAEGYRRGMTSGQMTQLQKRSWDGVNAHIAKAASRGSWDGSASTDLKRNVAKFIPSGDGAESFEKTIGGVIQEWMGQRTDQELSVMAGTSWGPSHTLHKTMMGVIAATSGLPPDRRSIFNPGGEVEGAVTSFTGNMSRLQIIGSYIADDDAMRQRSSTRYSAYRTWQAQTGEARAGATLGRMSYSESGKLGEAVDRLLEADAVGNTDNPAAIVDEIFGLASGMNEEGLLESAQYLLSLGRNLDNPFLEQAGFKLQSHGAYRRTNRKVEERYGSSTTRNMPLNTKLKEAWEAFGSIPGLKDDFGLGRGGQVNRRHMRDVGYAPTSLKASLERQFLPAWISNRMGTRAEGLKHIETLLTATLDTDGTGRIQEGKGMYGADSTDAEGNPQMDVENKSVANALFAMEQVAGLSQAGSAGGAGGGSGGAEVVQIARKLPLLNDAIDTFMENLKKKE